MDLPVSAIRVLNRREATATRRREALLWEVDRLNAAIDQLVPPRHLCRRSMGRDRSFQRSFGD